MNWMKRRAYFLGCIELIWMRLLEIPCIDKPTVSMCVDRDDLI